MINEHRLVQTFLELVAIDSPSGHEEAISEHLAGRLSALGAETYRDAHHNLIARWPQGRGDWVMLSAHLDTVGQDVGVKPLVHEGVIYSDGTTILGADDKSGIAVAIETALSMREDGLPHPPIEMVFTVGEETTMRGAKLLDKSVLLSRRGYILDSPGPIGTIVVSAPGQDSFEMIFRGKKAHAGEDPEKGINAIRVASEAIAGMALGRIDWETTSNIGVIHGGLATNIVPDEVRVLGEARSRDSTKLAAQRAAMVAVAQEAAGRHGVGVDVTVTHSHDPYRWDERTPPVAAAISAARRLGIEPILHDAGGGTDGNVFRENGIVCVPLSTGMADVHTSGEHIAVSDMVRATQFMREILAGS